jgi:hypothetical protein
LTLTWLSLAGLYAVVPAAFFALWFLDLWAKSYDLPVERLLAMAGLVVVVAVVSAGCSWLAARVTTLEVSGMARFALWLVIVPPVAAWVWALADLNWRATHLAAVAGIVATMLASRPLPRRATECLAVLVLLVAGVAVVNEHPRYRLGRYARALRHSCGCCGYKQRAVHELCALGPAGEAHVRSYLREAQPWASAVRDEWARCRSTR